MSKILKIDHLGIAVSNLEEAVKFYRDVLGLELEGFEDIPKQKVRVAMFRVGESRIELVEATSEDSAIYKYIKSRGEGLHHIALRVDDIRVFSREIAGKVDLIYKEPMDILGERLINFIHPKHSKGVMYELVERIKE